MTLVEYHANNDSISSLDVQKSNMAAGLGTRQAADEEARAEVVVGAPVDSLHGDTSLALNTNTF